MIFRVPCVLVTALALCAAVPTDLVPDERANWGKLPNGLTYAIMPNVEPPDRVSMRIYVRAGSLMETEAQRGLAHFLEHMAFNGTRHFPADKMVEYFQRLGMSFGADTNAHTGYDETVYKLELPNADSVLLNDAFRLLRDYADGMLLTDEEIEKERGVILSEKRTRDSADFRTYMARMKFLWPESRIASRVPIGLESVIKEAGREEFTRFYEGWYRPENMAVVVVGNVKAAEIAPLIEQYFSAMQGRGEAPPALDLGKIAASEVRAHVHYEKEAGGSSVTLTVLQPYEVTPDSRAKRLHGLKQYVAATILNKRLEKLTEKPDVAFISGRTYSYDWLDFATIGTITFSCEPAKWAETLATGEQEVRRVVQFGFTHAELAVAKANVLRYFERQVNTRPTKMSKALAGDLVRAIADREVFTSPEQDLVHAQEDLQSMTLKQVATVFREVWKDRAAQIFVSGNVEIEGGTDAVLNAFKASQAIAVEAPAEEEIPPFAYQSFGAPGAPVSDKLVEDLGIRTVTFANHTRLNVKQTDFEAETVQVRFRVGAGALCLPADKPAVRSMASRIFTAGGLVAHSRTELGRIFAGTTVGTSFGVEDDAFLFSGSCKPKELRQQLGYMTAFLLHPGYREDARERAIRSYEREWTAAQQEPDGVWGGAVDRYLANGDTRFGLASVAEFASVTIGDVRQALADALNKGALEVAIVGDIDPDLAVAAAAETVGALADRRSERQRFEDRREISYPPAGPRCHFSFESDSGKAMAVVIWPTEDIYDIKRTRRLSLLASVLTDRMRIEIREKTGAAYSPRAYSQASETYVGYGRIEAVVRCAPETAAELVDTLRRLAADLAESGLTQDELERAVQPRITGLKQWVRNNAYWAGNVMAACGEYPERLDWARSMEADIPAITREELAALAATYLRPELARMIIIEPVPEAKAE